MTTEQPPKFPPNYPRDMIGYGRNLPDANWPNGKKIAVQFVMNYEEGGENNILHGDEGSEAFLSEIVGAASWPGQRHMNMESIYEYGSRSGFWRLWRLFTSRKIPVTVFAVATALEKNLQAVEAMLEAKWEIATHGLKWIDYKDVSRDKERAHIEKACRIHERITGNAPSGLYQGRTSVNTLDIAMEMNCFDWLADIYNDDLPYWVESYGKHHLHIPYTLDANDMRFATPQGFNCGDQFYSYLKDSFDCLLNEGRAGTPKMMSIGLHCRLVGRPGRALALTKFIDYVLAHDDAWVCTRGEIAQHWNDNHSFPKAK